MSFVLSSRAFAPGDAIPARYTCDGEGVSPPLAWTDAPKETRAFALVMDDPDALGGTFTHWLLCDIPADVSALKEGETPTQTVSGTNGFHNPGYGGPCPPRWHGRHRYRFYLHALSRPLGLASGYSESELDAALRGCVLATATLTASYERMR